MALAGKLEGSGSFVYPIGAHQFHSTWLDHGYTLTEGEDGGFKFLGYRKEEDNL